MTASDIGVASELIPGIIEAHHNKPGGAAGLAPSISEIRCDRRLSIGFPDAVSAAEPDLTAVRECLRAAGNCRSGLL